MLSLGIAVALVAMAVGWYFGWRHGKAQGPDHPHDWEVRSVEHWASYADADARKEERASQRSTKVLWACRTCAARRVVEYDGKWSVEEIGMRRQKKEGFASPWEDYATR